MDGTRLIKFAYDKNIEDKLFLRWVVGYQTQMTFTDFKENMYSASKVDNRSKEEILADVKDILDGTF